jgi:3-oxoacyl-[acyl-carrier protein] reductase
MEVAGKTAIVTGSAVGVGRATALDLAKRGANVVVNYSRSEDNAKQTLADVEATGAKGLLLRADVSRDDDVRAMVAQTVERFGGVDILVNNAGITHFVDFRDLEGMTEEKWDNILAVNVKGLFFCSRAVVPEMQRRGAGCIVNVASTAGVRGMGSSIAYCASKAAVINLTMTFAQGFGPEIRVNCVAPGYIETRWHLARGGDPEPYRNVVANITPLKRVCRPEDVAQAILGFVECGDMVTGQTLVVDGGLTMHL